MSKNEGIIMKTRQLKSIIEDDSEKGDKDRFFYNVPYVAYFQSASAHSPHQPGGKVSPDSRRHNLFIIDEKKKKYFTRKIREWGKKNFILYPWREEKNIYRLLLTEIFLQKTDSLKIKQLYPLFNGIEGPREMLENEKTLDYIVSKTGLSYKKERILYLSRQLLENFNGEVPSDYRSLRALKGVGDYIANAVLTFGFKRRAAIVDTNTIRIVESFFGFRSEKKRSRDDRGMNEFLLSILPQTRCDLFNYYLLDFGALVCTRFRRKCGECPLKRQCNYFHLSDFHKQPQDSG
jgi:A/G-specific adenine glycosylase